MLLLLLIFSYLFPIFFSVFSHLCTLWTGTMVGKDFKISI